MSHCWGALFGDLVAAAAHYSPPHRRVWIDLFAVRQWPGNVADLAFEGVVKRCKSVALVVVPLKIPNLVWEKDNWDDFMNLGGFFRYVM